MKAIFTLSALALFCSGELPGVMALIHCPPPNIIPAEANDIVFKKSLRVDMINYVKLWLMFSFEWTSYQVETYAQYAPCKV
jgi:hypothetical protein